MQKPEIKKGLMICHLNIRDIKSSNKRDDVQVILSQLDIDVFAISETWLTESISSSLLEMPGYQTIRQDRKTKSWRKRGGGILIYVKTDYEVTEESHAFLSLTECIKFSIEKPHMKPINL